MEKMNISLLADNMKQKQWAVYGIKNFIYIYGEIDKEIDMIARR